MVKTQPHSVYSRGSALVASRGEYSTFGPSRQCSPPAGIRPIGREDAGVKPTRRRAGRFSPAPQHFIRKRLFNEAQGAHARPTSRDTTRAPRHTHTGRRECDEDDDHDDHDDHDDDRDDDDDDDDHDVDERPRRPVTRFSKSSSSSSFFRYRRHFFFFLPSSNQTSTTPGEKEREREREREGERGRKKKRERERERKRSAKKNVETRRTLRITASLQEDYKGDVGQLDLDRSMVVIEEEREDQEYSRREEKARKMSDNVRDIDS